MKPVPFFTDDIAIVPHTATNAAQIGKPITLSAFAAGRPVSLYQVESGELLARLADHTFIQGPEKAADHHYYDTSAAAYDATQTGEAPRGHILICADGVVGLSYTYPLALTEECGEFHHISQGFSASILCDANISEEQVRKAVDVCKARNLPFADWVKEHFGGDL